MSDHANIRSALLRWFRKHARPLPWRKRKDAYSIWVSEVMLQQTQVDTVLPYYRRFLHAFPTVTELASARLERVLSLWSGLGYYRRARHLHLAAKKVSRDFGGRFPKDYEQARSLPGVGHYTARAVLSIAYAQPYAVFDGNVTRVLSRLRLLRGNLHQALFRRIIETELERLLAPRQPGNFNQALMELGQTVCLPRAPRCLICPVRKWCGAYRLEDPASYPEPRPRRASELRYLAVALVRLGSGTGPAVVPATRKRGTFVEQGENSRDLRPAAVKWSLDRNAKVLMTRGLDEGLMPDLWNLPAAFGPSRRRALQRLRERLVAMINPLHWDGQPMPAISLFQFRYGITYRSIVVDVYAAEATANLRQNSLRWVALSRLPELAVSQLARKIAAKLTAASADSTPSSSRACPSGCSVARF